MPLHDPDNIILERFLDYFRGMVWIVVMLELPIVVMLELVSDSLCFHQKSGCNSPFLMIS